jgi:hypothetical protein
MMFRPAAVPSNDQRDDHQPWHVRRAGGGSAACRTRQPDPGIAGPGAGRTTHPAQSRRAARSAVPARAHAANGAAANDSLKSVGP